MDRSIAGLGGSFHPCGIAVIVVPCLQGWNNYSKGGSMGRRRIKRNQTHSKKLRGNWRATPPSVELAAQIKQQRRIAKLRALAKPPVDDTTGATEEGSDGEHVA